MHYLFMLFLIGGEDSPIDAYRVYERLTFESLEECVEFYNENKEDFDTAANFSSGGRHWRLGCGDEEFKLNLENLRKPSNSLNPKLIFS